MIKFKKLHDIIFELSYNGLSHLNQMCTLIIAKMLGCLIPPRQYVSRRWAEAEEKII